ncbi:MAG: response regulator [Polyangiaceae bacterium]|nr:response regulator [Polyangiaceae bacterium]
MTVKGSILAVDDTHASLKLLADILTQAGYQVRPADSGALALASAVARPPDLILLDINMPGMGGFELCRKLRDHEALRDVLVLFISALSEMQDKLAAFDAGGQDYITKPFQAEEVLARVGTHVRVRRLQHELERRVEERTAELRRTQEQLHHAQKLEAVGRLAGGIAHDFNNILSVVLTYSDIVLGDVPHDWPLRPELEEIQRAGARAAELTRHLLAFSRQQVLTPKVLDLNEVVRACCRMLGRVLGEDIELQTVLAPELGTVLADPGQVEQVLMNLVVNARDAMPTGGMLTVGTANAHLDDSYAAEHVGVAAGDYVMLSVNDTGSGMDKATQSRAFEPFFTTKERGKGTGLGLSTVFGIVNQSGGHIWLYSEPGVGTTFKIYLPRTRGQHRPESLPPQIALGGTETILLAEDDDQVRTVAEGILRRAGYRVIATTSPAAALAVCADQAVSFDLLLTDVVMPKMSGRELAERIGIERPGIRVLFMSGYTDDAVLRHGVLEAGVAFIQKPLTPAALGRKVREVLDLGRDGERP